MSFLKRIFSIIFQFGVLVFMASCKQESIMFHPDELPEDHVFVFREKYQELFFQVGEQTKLNALLFHADSSKGVVFYLHGNAGSIDSWGEIAEVYLANHYDFFILDYRGFGKSQGKISSEKQFHADIQLVYDSLKTRYDEQNIVVIGYSIGTGPATKLASVNNPKMLILKAPYFNIPDLAKHYSSMVPSVFIKYTFKTNEFITQVKCPIVIFHGDYDEVIPVESTHKLQPLLKNDDRVYILKGQPHNGINENPIYQSELRLILAK